MLTVKILHVSAKHPVFLGVCSTYVAENILVSRANKSFAVICKQTNFQD